MVRWVISSTAGESISVSFLESHLIRYFGSLITSEEALLKKISLEMWNKASRAGDTFWHYFDREKWEVTKCPSKENSLCKHKSTSTQLDIFMSVQRKCCLWWLLTSNDLIRKSRSLKKLKSKEVVLTSEEFPEICRHQHSWTHQRCQALRLHISPQVGPSSLFLSHFNVLFLQIILMVLLPPEFT